MRLLHLSLVAGLLLSIMAAGASAAAEKTIELIFERSEGVILEGRVGEEPLNFLVEVYPGLRMSVSIDSEAGAQFKVRPEQTAQLAEYGTGAGATGEGTEITSPGRYVITVSKGADVDSQGHSARFDLAMERSSLPGSGFGASVRAKSVPEVQVSFMPEVCEGEAHAAFFPSEGVTSEISLSVRKHGYLAKGTRDSSDKAILFECWFDAGGVFQAFTRHDAESSDIALGLDLTATIDQQALRCAAVFQILVLYSESTEDDANEAAYRNKFSQVEDRVIRGDENSGDVGAWSTNSIQLEITNFVKLLEVSPEHGAQLLGSILSDCNEAFP